jgi:hypothetical protein
MTIVINTARRGGIRPKEAFMNTCHIVFCVSLPVQGAPKQF